MWYDRKNVTPEEAEKERLRLIALEEREDDEFDEERIADMADINEIDALKGIEDYVNPKKGKKITKRKKRKCPYCGSEHIAEYLYGMPIPDEKLMKQEREGKLIFAGCVIRDSDPRYHCNDCGKDFGKRKE